MLWRRRLGMRLRSLREKKVADDALAGELEFHLAALRAENVAAGMTEAEADAAARRSFGTEALIAEECRDQRRTAPVEDFVQDVRFAVRCFRKNLAFSGVAAATLALCIGVNAAFLLTAYAIAWKPLPFPRSERLVALEDFAGPGPVTSLRRLAHEADYAGYAPNNDVTLQLGGEAVKLRGATATWNLTRVLGVAPERGRWFAEGEEAAGHEREVVLSDRTWRNRFGRDPGVIGRVLPINDQAYTVVGIMPQRFAFPTPETELWLPVRIDPQNVGELWGGSNLIGVGRLREGATFGMAQGELRPLVNRVRGMFPWRMPDAWGGSSHVATLAQAITEDARPKVLALVVAASLLLLIGCVNVTNLLLAQGVRRKREWAMREALGARRGRLVRQLITESFVLMASGSALGVVLAAGIVMSLPALLPANTPRLTEITMDPSLLVAVAVSAAIAALLLVTVPLIQLRRPSKETLVAKQMGQGRGRSVVSLALIGSELALSTALMIGAGLMGRTLLHLNQVDAGIRTGGVVTARVSLGRNACGNAVQCWSALEKLSGQVGQQPGVESVSWATATPLSKDGAAMAMYLEDYPRAPNEPAYVLWETGVTPGYFGQLGVTLKQGRMFDDRDRTGAAAVTIISESTARHYWPRGNAVGRRIRLVWQGEWQTIVGVVGDVSNYALTGFPGWVDGVEYRPLAQALPRTRDGMELSLFVRSRQPGQALADLGRLPSQFADVAVSHGMTLERTRAESVADQRSTTALLALFAGLGLVLGALGVHGVVAHRVGQRTREIGIRMALGASAQGVVRMILMETAGVAVFGLGVGVLGALALTRYLRSLLFGVGSHDPVTFAVSPILLLVVAVAAALFPALAAARTDPSATLRHD